MANSRFNKQISPKGYREGGKVKKGKTSPGPKAGRPKTATTPPKSPRKGLGPAGSSKKTNKVDADKLKSLEPIIIDLDLSRPENERKIKIKKYKSLK